MMLPPAHRIARHNYPTRTASFAYAFVVMAALWIERGRVSPWEVALAAFIFLAYPHLAFVHARIAQQSKQAELNNLYADCVLLGLWVAQIHFALWPAVGILGAVCLNAAGHGHVRRLVISLALFGTSAGIWSLVTGASFRPDTGPMVTIASAMGILAYVSVVGTLVHTQNRTLVKARAALEAADSVQLPFPDLTGSGQNPARDQN